MAGQTPKNRPTATETLYRAGEQDPVAALDELGRILGVKGRVLPMCPIALQIEADVAGLEGVENIYAFPRVAKDKSSIAIHLVNWNELQGGKQADTYSM